MQDKLLYFLLGWAICATLLAVFFGWLLYRKETYQIRNLKQKNKRNSGSNIDNDITPHIETKQRKRRLKQIFTKNKK